MRSNLSSQRSVHFVTLRARPHTALNKSNLATLAAYNQDIKIEHAIGCKHPRPGYLYRFEDQLVRFVNEDWDDKARNSETWNSLQQVFVKNAVVYWVGDKYLRKYREQPP